MSPSAWKRDQHLYHPFFCEENVWHLLEAAPPSAWAVFIRASAGPVWMTMQRADQPDQIIGWDYHVVVLLASSRPAQIADLDSYLEFPCSLDRYLQESFPIHAPETSRPRFRLVPKATYRTKLRTDRRHMKQLDGTWIHPPPPWPPLTPGEHDLDVWLAAPADHWIGPAALRRRFARAR